MITTNSNTSSPEDLPAETPARHSPRKYSLLRGILLGLTMALVISVTLAVVRNRSNITPLTVAAYDAAVERWEKNAPQDYDLDLELSGNRPGKIQVEVRGGEVVHMTRDGVEPSQKRTWDYWSVPGQLETIGQEIEMAKNPAESFGVPGAAEVVMWAEFDTRYGYPRQYHRVVLGGDVEVHWKMTRFEAKYGKK